jgi:hypothetical protein
MTPITSFFLLMIVSSTGVVIFGLNLFIICFPFLIEPTKKAQGVKYIIAQIISRSINKVQLLVVKAIGYFTFLAELSPMSMLLFGRIALAIYGVGLILVIIHNIYGGRQSFHEPKSTRKESLLIILMFVKGFLIYVSVIAIGYSMSMIYGWAWGIVFAICVLIVQFQVGHFIWRRF